MRRPVSAPALRLIRAEEPASRVANWRAEVIVQLLERYDKAVKRAAERKEARRWGPLEEDRLRQAFNVERLTIRAIADELARTPAHVEHRLIILGLLDRGAIRRVPNAEIATALPQPPKSAEEQKPLYSFSNTVYYQPDDEPEGELKDDNDSDNEEEEEEQQPRDDAEFEEPESVNFEDLAENHYGALGGTRGRGLN